ncbi:hypothetical protein NL351_30475, partial [Klebsiella pneumoniae]|nr:hypothetical protein [Klebsiella pneumoniae]
MTEKYRTMAVAADGAFTVKLFCYPVWIDEISGYRLEWYLYNLNRSVVYKVTDKVQVTPNTLAFD